jgi:hypothetical protein
VAPLHLTHGIYVWLCGAHRTPEYLGRRSGQVFTKRLAAAWAACGTLTKRRRDALAAHLSRTRTGPAERDLPGSYSWPKLRAEAERRYAAGEPPAEVIADLRANYRDGPALVPSVRTMRRWFTQARWLTIAVAHTRRSSSRGGDWQPLINLILTGRAYPRPNPLRLRPG